METRRSGNKRCIRDNLCRTLWWQSLFRGAYPCMLIETARFAKSQLLRWINSDACKPGFLLQSYYDFSASVLFFQIPDSFWHLAQFVPPVDDRGHLSGRHEIMHDGQVLFIRFRQKRDQFLTAELRQHKRCEQTGQNAECASTGQFSDHDANPLRI